MYNFIKNSSAIFIYNLIMTLTVLFWAAYGLYHYNKPAIEDYVKWTQCEPEECQRRQGKING